MARSLFREGQIIDADVLTENEHDGLVHNNLTVSGVLNVSGTINCNSIYIEDGYTGILSVVSSITTEGVVTNLSLNFTNGILTTVTEQADSYITTASGSYLLLS